MPTLSLEGAVQRLRLRKRARKSVEQESATCIGVRQPVEHELDGQLVRHVLAKIHVLPHLLCDSRVLTPDLTKEVSTGNVGTAKHLSQTLGLCPLARARRAEKYDVH